MLSEEQVATQQGQRTFRPVSPASADTSTTAFANPASKRKNKRRDVTTVASCCTRMVRL